MLIWAPRLRSQLSRTGLFVAGLTKMEVAKAPFSRLALVLLVSCVIVRKAHAQEAEACTEDEFQCGNGRCIPDSFQCDGEDDCRDNSDEFNCTGCRRGKFMCEDGGCLPSIFRCDGIGDCDDDSDETNCRLGFLDTLGGVFDELTTTQTVPRPYPVTSVPPSSVLEQGTMLAVCTDQEFTCADGSRCVPRLFVCDGERDCADNSDEMDCPPKTCGQDRFTCGSGDCIPRAWACDRDVDCADGSDESEELCQERNCTEKEYRCENSTKCVHLTWFCDGDKDCREGEDEADCDQKESRPCADGDWRCDAGKCISAGWRCDGEQDCTDGTDEESCEPRLRAQNTTSLDIPAQSNMTLGVNDTVIPEVGQFDKPGVCPQLGFPLHQSSPTCSRDACVSDFHCPGDLKCCVNGCGGTMCVDPSPQPTTLFEQEAGCANYDCGMQGAYCSGIVAGSAQCYCRPRAECEAKDTVCDKYGTMYPSMCHFEAFACEWGFPMEPAPCQDYNVQDIFKCKNGIRYVLKPYICDGTSDCFDDSDETGCPFKEPPPTPPTANVCNLPLFRGRPCANASPRLRWYYNSQKRTCLTYMHEGCERNANSFGTREECLENVNAKRCVVKRTYSQRIPDLPQTTAAPSKDPEVVCNQLKDRGPCRGRQKKYYYLSTQRRCVRFTYGGCGGNDNRFHTYMECMDFCNDPRTKCQQQRAKAANAGLQVGMFIPECRPDGAFEEVQCHGSTGHCWCVDRDGEELPGTRVDRGFTPTCSAEKGKCHVDRGLAIDARLGPGAYVPQCREDGTYDPLQCHGSTGECWCVSEHGDEISGSRVSPGQLVPNCGDLSARTRRPQSQCEQEQQQVLAVALPGAYVPQCRDDGSFSPVQCHGSSGHCWCADQFGNEVAGTRVRPGESPRCSAEAPVTDAPPKTKCQEEREDANSRGLLAGVYVPQCTGDGLYSPVQCHGSTGQCWCVNDAGEEIMGTRVDAGESPNCAGTPETTKCQLEREEMLSEGPLLGAYIPTCAEDGSYDVIQCHDSTGHCWCVDREGEEILGTRVGPQEDVVCDNDLASPKPGTKEGKMPLGSETEDVTEAPKPTVTVKPVTVKAETQKNETERFLPPEKGLSAFQNLTCRDARRRALRLFWYNFTSADEVSYIPTCTADGKFFPMQCYGASGYCFCVDESGKEIPGTVSEPGARPVCSGVDDAKVDVWETGSGEDGGEGPTEEIELFTAAPTPDKAVLPTEPPVIDTTTASTLTATPTATTTSSKPGPGTTATPALDTTAQPGPDVSTRMPTLCERARAEALTALKASPDHANGSRSSFVPTCTEEGRYTPRQCYLDGVNCFCVNKYGNALSAVARLTEGEELDCEEHDYQTAAPPIAEPRTEPPSRPAGCCPSGSSLVLSPPVVVKDVGRGGWYSSWARDPLDPSPIYIFDGPRSIQKYDNDHAIMNDQVSRTWELPSDIAGNGQLVYGGSAYYNRAGTQDLIKFDLENERVAARQQLPFAGIQNAYSYSWGGSTDIDFAVDEFGLYVIYGTRQNRGNMVVSQINPQDLSIINTWNAGYFKRAAGNAFMRCGVLYATDAHDFTAKISYSFDTRTEQEHEVLVQLRDPYRYNTMLDYNPADKKLYLWDETYLITYDVMCEKDDPAPGVTAAATSTPLPTTTTPPAPTPPPTPRPTTTPSARETICRLKKRRGPCRAKISRYYYLPSRDTCVKFRFGGCGGNANNFHSWAECMETCTERGDVPKSPVPQPGPAVETPRKTPRPEVEVPSYMGDACILPAEPGPCQESHSRWHFDPVSRVCQEFQYGGCGGNTNRFGSWRECTIECLGQQAVQCGGCKHERHGLHRGYCNNQFVMTGRVSKLELTPSWRVVTMVTDSEMISKRGGLRSIQYQGRDLAVQVLLPRNYNNKHGCPCYDVARGAEYVMMGRVDGNGYGMVDEKGYMAELNNKYARRLQQLKANPFSCSYSYHDTSRQGSNPYARYPGSNPNPQNPRSYPQNPQPNPYPSNPRPYPQNPQPRPQNPQPHPQYPQPYPQNPQPQNPQPYPQNPQPQNPQPYPHNPQPYPQNPQPYPQNPHPQNPQPYPQNPHPQNPQPYPQDPRSNPHYPQPSPQYPGYNPYSPGSNPQYPGSYPQDPRSHSQYPGYNPGPRHQSVPNTAARGRSSYTYRSAQKR
ncbi:uncharacterized protein LOC144922725 [Branchiostoma floridae x Branchiostoma belcheri]